MKFLHRTSKGGEMHFFWPKKDDHDEMFHLNIIYGPVKLHGCGDYTIKAIKEISEKFEKLQKP